MSWVGPEHRPVTSLPPCDFELPTYTLDTYPISSITPIMSDPLVDWTKERLTLLYKMDSTSPEADFPKILESTFKPDARITDNHQFINLAKFGEELKRSSFAVTRADIEWKGIVAMPNQGNEENTQVRIHPRLGELAH